MDMRERVASYLYKSPSQTDCWRSREECLTDADSILALVEQERAALLHDIEAYRGALGYPIPGDHNAKLTDGMQPVCGLCDAKEKLLAAAEVERDKYRDDLNNWRSQCLVETQRSDKAEAREAKLVDELSQTRIGLDVQEKALARSRACVAKLEEAMQQVHDLCWGERGLMSVSLSPSTADTDHAKAHRILDAALAAVKEEK